MVDVMLGYTVAVCPFDGFQVLWNL